MFAYTPLGWAHKSGMVLRIRGNLYGSPPAGKNFADTVALIIKSVGFISTAYDPKFFCMWKEELPILLIIHSDNFKIFLRPQFMYVRELLLDALREKGYGIEDTSEELFVGIDIKQHADGHYTMNQRQAIEKLLAEVDMTGVTENRLPYPTTQEQPETLSKKDNLANLSHVSAADMLECKTFPYRKVIGSLLYIYLHTMPQIMFHLNLLSRFSNDPGPRHIMWIKHLVAFVKGARFDEIVFPTHTGPYDITTMTARLQSAWWTDADLGGNIDNGHSYTCYIGKNGRAIICYCSTTQSSLSTATAESELKSVNHTLKHEAISVIQILNFMGWKQNTVPFYQDNAAVVYAARQPNMTKGLRHLDLNELFFKEKQEDKTIKLIKVAGTDNIADLGTKRVGWPIFAKITDSIMSCKNKFYKIWRAKALEKNEKENR